LPSLSIRSKICLTPERTCPRTPRKSCFSIRNLPWTLKQCLWKSDLASGESYRDRRMVCRRYFALQAGQESAQSSYYKSRTHWESKYQGFTREKSQPWGLSGILFMFSKMYWRDISMDHVTPS
jgi:hypothetical protein